MAAPKANTVQSDRETHRLSYPHLRRKPYWGNHFWARGYFVSTVGVNEELIRRYVRYQEDQERKEERERSSYELFKSSSPKLFTS